MLMIRVITKPVILVLLLAVGLIKWLDGDDEDARFVTPGVPIVSLGFLTVGEATFPLTGLLAYGNVAWWTMVAALFSGVAMMLTVIGQRTLSLRTDGSLVDRISREWGRLGTVTMVVWFVATRLHAVLIVAHVIVNCVAAPFGGHAPSAQLVIYAGILGSFWLKTEGQDLWDQIASLSDAFLAVIRGPRF